MNQINLGREPGEKEGFLSCGIAAAHHRYGNVPIKCAIAGRARCQPMPDEFLLVLQPEVARRGAACNDKRFGLQPFLVVNLQTNVRIQRLEPGRFCIGKAGAEFFCLRMHVQD